MNRKEERTLSAFLTTVDFLEKNATVTATVPHFAPAFVAFKATTVSIKAIAEQQSTLNNSIGTHSKTSLRAECYEMLRTLFDVLKAHAAGTNNASLESATKGSMTQFARKADTAFLTACRQYHALVAGLLADLVVYNIDAAYLLNFKNSIDGYENILTTPRLNIIARADSTKILGDLFVQGRAELDKLTLLVTIKRNSEPSFFSQYIESTRVIDNGSTPHALRVAAKNEQDAGVKDVHLHFLRLIDNKAVSYKTNDNGTIIRSNFKAGAYLLTATKTGYAPFISNILVESGITCVVNIVVDSVEKTIA